jgi:hypothetical protein
MTSRTTPVGFLVIALAGLFVMGCSAQTGAVFEALLDPDPARLSASEGETAMDAATESAAPATWWPLPEGYNMVLPAGWSGVSVDRAGAGRLMEAVAASSPALAQRMSDVLGGTGTRVSAVAGDRSAASDSGPMLLVLTQPTDGRKRHELKQHVRRQISQLPGIAGKPVVQDASLSAARGWRVDFSVVDPDLGALRVRSYLIPFGRHAYLVNFIASEDAVDDADELFDAIADSLNFGV